MLIVVPVCLGGMSAAASTGERRTVHAGRELPAASPFPRLDLHLFRRDPFVGFSLDGNRARYGDGTVVELRTFACSPAQDVRVVHDPQSKFRSIANGWARNNTSMALLRLPGFMRDPAFVAGKVIVDLGAGDSDCVSILRGHGASAFGVDLFVTRGQLLTGFFVPADARDTPFKAGVVDVAHSSLGPLYYHDYEPAFLKDWVAELTRILKPGGLLIGSPVPDDPSYARSFAGSFVVPKTPTSDFVVLTRRQNPIP